MSNKKLILILGALVAVYLIAKFFSGNRQSTFDPVIVKVDTTAVTEIHLYPKAEDNAEVILKRTGDEWTVTKGDKTFKTPDSKVQGILAQLTEMRSDRVVSRSKDKWAEYEVNEKGSRVEVFSNKKKVADFIVGNFKFDQAKRSAFSYVRKSDSDEVYLVDGFMSMSFNQAFNTFRNNELIKVNREDVREVAVMQNGQKTAISKNLEDGQWYFGGMEKVDSAKASQYIGQLSNAFGQDYLEAAVQSAPLKSMEINANNIMAPIKVDCYAHPDSAHQFVLHSSSNPEAWFVSDSSGLYNRLFVKFDELIPTDIE